MTAPELKPCPFCGGEAITSPSVVDRQVLYAHCKDHTCPGWTVSRCPTVRWNRRADRAEAELAAQIEAVDTPCYWPSCGHSAKGQCLPSIRAVTHDRTALDRMLAEADD